MGVGVLLPQLAAGMSKLLPLVPLVPSLWWHAVEPTEHNKDKREGWKDIDRQVPHGSGCGNKFGGFVWVLMLELEQNLG